MSDDPETARQIEELAADDRPLLVLDRNRLDLRSIRRGWLSLARRWCCSPPTCSR